MMIVTVTLNPCIDKTLFVNRFEPGECVNVCRVSRLGAGKGINVSRAVGRLGGETSAVWLCGGHTGRFIAASLKAEGIPNRPVAVAAELRTATTIHDLSTGASTRFFEPGPDVGPDEARKLVRVVKTSLRAGDILVLSGSVPCSSLDGLYVELIRVASAKGARTVLDSRDAALRLGLLERPTFVKANQDEAGMILGRGVADVKDAVSAAEAMLRDGVQVAVVSLGRAGAVLAGGDGQWTAGAPAVQEASAVGSGDSMVGAMSLGLSLGWELPDLLRWGVAAGAANAEGWIPGGFRRESVENLLKKVVVTRLG